MRKRWIAAVCVLVSSGAMAQTNETEVRNPNNGHYYSLIRPLPGVSFYDTAQAEAIARGGNLATIRSIQEVQWIQSTFEPFTSDNDIYIGLNDIAVEGTFEWINGEPVSFTNWSAGEPNNSGNEDVTEMRLNDGLWNDNSAGGAQPSLMERIVFEFKTFPSGGGFVIEGTDVTLIGEAWGNIGPVSYQWKKNGAILSGETGTSLALTSVTPTDDGLYTLEATDSSKAVISSSVGIKVVMPGALPVGGIIGVGLLVGAISAGGVLKMRRHQR